MNKLCVLLALVLLVVGCSQHTSPEQQQYADAVVRENAIAVNDVWHKATLRGVAFRAIGQEPGWLLEMTAGHDILVSTDYGQTQKRYPYVQPNNDQTTRTSHFTLDGLTIEIQSMPCNDVMSGERFESTVELQYSTHTLKGCGRSLY